jgi:hypothetical protein
MAAGSVEALVRANPLKFTRDRCMDVSQVP